MCGIFVVLKSENEFLDPTSNRDHPQNLVDCFSPFSSFFFCCCCHYYSHSTTSVIYNVRWLSFKTKYRTERVQDTDRATDDFSATAKT